MNTKQIVWRFFNNYILKIAKKGQKTLDFTALMFLLHKFGNVYDNRSAKNYIDCMVDNAWLIPNEANPLDILSPYVVTSVYKYRRITWTINENATFDLIDEDKILDQLIK